MGRIFLNSGRLEKCSKPIIKHVAQYPPNLVVWPPVQHRYQHPPPSPATDDAAGGVAFLASSPPATPSPPGTPPSLPAAVAASKEMNGVTATRAAAAAGPNRETTSSAEMKPPLPSYYLCCPRLSLVSPPKTVSRPPPRHPPAPPPPPPIRCSHKHSKPAQCRDRPSRSREDRACPSSRPECPLTTLLRRRLMSCSCWTTVSLRQQNDVVLLVFEGIHWTARWARTSPPCPPETSTQIPPKYSAGVE